MFHLQTLLSLVQSIGLHRRNSLLLQLHRRQSSSCSRPQKITEPRTPSQNFGWIGSLTREFSHLKHLVLLLAPTPLLELNKLYMRTISRSKYILQEKIVYEGKKIFSKAGSRNACNG
ncbi:hypothetical protein NE237_017167 [Protea cynaroides]|uniref:Uncharacterized protein n=1 Tax=Protea cynaroides TaxID=273540 RepID=A0A9Q0K7J2_9MAGN|nr:hypothetical protein NE237_017167 [Protea cynaroides]